MTTMTRTRTATEKQMAFLEKLMGERQVHPDHIARIKQLQTEGRLDVKTASKAIDFFLQHPVTGAGSKPEPDEDPIDLTDLPAGRYAVPGGDTRLKVKVDKPGGKWTGWVFVRDAAVYGEGQRYGSQRPDGTYRGKIREELKAILADPRAAMVRYAELTSTCGNCGRALEDEESVARGIGPVCAENLGWL